MDCLYIIFMFTMVVFSIIILINQHKIKGDLKKIMGQQEEFNAKITAANEALNGIATSQGEIADAIAAEAEQIAEFIRTHPGIDTTALDGVVTRLTTANESLATVNEAISNVFEPPAPEGKPANS